MIGRIKESWQQFRESKPGNRFQDHYRRRHQGGGVNLRTVFSIASGIAVMLAGLFFVPAPGPGWAIFFVGVGMLAGEFLFIARFLDWGEVKTRRLAQQAMRAWSSSPTMVKVLIVVVALLCVAAAGYGAYGLFFQEPPALSSGRPAGF